MKQPTLIILGISLSVAASSCALPPANSASYQPRMSPQQQAAMQSRIEAGYQKDRVEDRRDSREAAENERISNIGRPPSYHQHNTWFWF